MDFVKYFDYFGIRFHFYTNNQPYYQNFFGGIMNLIYIILCVVVFIFFSYDDLKMLNPTTTTSDISDKEARIVELNKEKIWIPFRLVNWENQFIKHKGILNIVPYFIEGKFDDVKGMDLKYHLLNYTLCNETSMANKPENYRINVPLSELYCIEQEGVLFGGHWNSKFLDYIEINVFLCDGNIMYNESDPRCKNTFELLKRQNSSIIFDFYYPVVQFQPRNLETPIAIIYKNFYYRISSFSRKLEKVYIREHILSDDKNMLTTNYKNSSIWGVSLLYSDDYSLVNEFDAIGNTDLKLAYSLDIFMDNGFIYYTRSYKKIILIISNVFPIFKFLLYFMKKFTQHAKMSSTKRKLAGLIFEYKKIKKQNSFMNKFEDIKMPNEKLIRPSKINEYNNKKNDKTKENYMKNKLINFRFYSNKEINFDNSMDFINKNKECKREDKGKDKSKSHLNLREENNPIKLLNKKELLSLDKNNKLTVSAPFQIKDFPFEDKRQKYKKVEHIFPYYYFFLDFFLDKLIYPQKFFCLHSSYLTVYNFMGRIYDISTHIILFKHFNLLNILVKKIYENNDLTGSKPFKKINIRDKKIVEKLNDDLRGRKSILFSNNLI
jgi:hypothetical protein